MRKCRLLVDGARYHVTARAHHGELVLESPQFKDLFLKIVSRAKEKYDFRLENLCIMGNHIHMIIQPGPETSLSRIMQWILGVFAQSWNRMNGWTGQGEVWGQRFFSRILRSLAEYLHTFLYIDSNPVRAQLADAITEYLFGGPKLRESGAPWLFSPPLAGG